METALHTGSQALVRLGARLDELHAATATPVTARRPWLQAWVDSNPDVEPVLVVVQAGERLEAAALLGRTRRRLFHDYVALGHGPSDQLRLPARGVEAARCLARALAAHLAALSGPWRMVVRHLPVGDPVAAALVADLACAQIVPGDVSPSLRFGSERSLRGSVSRNHHQQVRRMLNRMQREGLQPLVEHTRERDAIERLLPEVEEICRLRDHELRGRSGLDHENVSRFFRHVIRAHAELGEVELTTLRLGPRLAAYVLCFLDGGVQRMWSCRLAPEFGRYGPGRVANNAALERALADPSCNEFDWMRGDEPYKLSMSNHLEHASDLLAWSTPTLKAVLDAPRRLKVMVKSSALLSRWIRPAVAAGKRLSSHGRRRGRAALEALRKRRE